MWTRAILWYCGVEPTLDAGSSFCLRKRSQEYLRTRTLAASCRCMFESPPLGQGGWPARIDTSRTRRATSCEQADRIVAGRTWPISPNVEKRLSVLLTLIGRSQLWGVDSHAEGLEHQLQLPSRHATSNPGNFSYGTYCNRRIKSAPITLSSCVCAGTAFRAQFSVLVARRATKV